MLLLLTMMLMMRKGEKCQSGQYGPCQRRPTCRATAADPESEDCGSAATSAKTLWYFRLIKEPGISSSTGQNGRWWRHMFQARVSLALVNAL